MSDAMDIAQRLHDSPDLLPWVIFAFVVGFIFYERKALTEILHSVADYFRAKKETSVLMVEVVRNNSITTEHNTEALERNTATMKMVMDDRRETRAMVASHEQMSKERMQHIQEVVNRIDKTVTENSKDIGLVEDRTRRG